MVKVDLYIIRVAIRFSDIRQKILVCQGSALDPLLLFYLHK